MASRACTEIFGAVERRAARVGHELEPGASAAACSAAVASSHSLGSPTNFSESSRVDSSR
jgi:hypothetical protein